MSHEGHIPPKQEKTHGHEETHDQESRSQEDHEESARGKVSAKKPAVKKEKKLSALDAAAQILTDSKQALTTKEMIKQMATKKLWTSPGGATPHATLYSAIHREINAKGKDARFKKTERGKFTFAS